MRLLSNLQKEYRKFVVYRLAQFTDYIQLLQKIGVDSIGIEEFVMMISASDVRGLVYSVHDLLNEPFQRLIDKKSRSISRFSDRSFHVFYCSFQQETAEAESRYWAERTFFGVKNSSRTLFCRVLSCFLMV